MAIMNDDEAVECGAAWAEVERLTNTLNTYTDTVAGIFREINELAEQTLGQPIEPGHTAVYAVELLVERLKDVEAELASARKVIDDRGICERDASVPLPDRLAKLANALEQEG